MTNGSELENSVLFQSLIINFQMSAMIHLGKIVNPITKKAERNLNEAQVAIDMLTMLAEKTKGNLTPEEDRLLQQTLTDLRLNYIYEKSQPEIKKAEETIQESKTNTESKET